jgi:hypothetical protein
MCHTDCDEAMMMVKVKKIEAFFPAPNFLAVLQSFVSGMDMVKWFLFVRVSQNVSNNRVFEATTFASSGASTNVDVLRYVYDRACAGDMMLSSTRNCTIFHV